MVKHLTAVPESRWIGSIALLLVLAGAATGCGGSDEPSDAPDPDPGGSTAATDPDDGSEEAAIDEPEAAGTGGATLTMVDDTVYELVLSSCDTQDTDSSAFPITNGYDITGRTADQAFSFSMTRAGFTDEDIFFSGLFEGDFDDEGKNAGMLYNVDGETVDVTASGNQISGTLDLRAIGPTRPHGDETSATLEASC